MSDLLKKAVQSYQGGHFAEALANLHRVMQSPKLRTQELYSLLGNTHLRLGQSLEAGEAFAKGAAAPGPNAAMLAKFAMGLFARAGARARIVEFGRRALDLHPNDTALAFDYASALFAEGRYADAAALAPRLNRADSDHLALVINAYRLTGQFAALSRELEDRHRREPGNLLVSVSRYVIAREIADFAVSAEQDALMLREDEPAVRALREAEPAMARLLWSRSDRVNALPSSDSLRLAAVPAAPARRPISPEGERLRIGYLSSDFHDHATMRLFEDVLALHDRTKFDVTLFCYTDPHQVSWQGRNFPPQVLSRIVFVGGMDDGRAAEEIAARRIDILVDLKGHTMNARLGIAKRSDAPVKVTYLGYPGSVTGGDFDYALTDPVVTPDSAIPHFEESLCRLPETYQANGSLRRPLPRALTRAEAGLPEGRFVFASFNAIQKITAETLKLWAAALAAVPESLLWILAARSETQANLLAAFAAHGVPAERILFAENRPYADHVARLGAADLGLDTFPYNGHTTTSDMLWAGLPVLTLEGDAFQARVSESLLKSAGLEGEGTGMDTLVAADAGDFVARARTLAADPARIAALKARLEQTRFRAPLFDSARFTAHLEEAYRLMAARARAGLAPVLIDVPALPPRLEGFSGRTRS
jgi:predicted O-linked N-acetylglucosamine transferase (SPINDLY family)